MRRLMENFLLVLTGDVTRRVLGFVAVAYLARTIGTQGFGMVNIGFAVLSYTIMASSAGLASLGAREIAKGNSGDIVGKILGLRTALSIITFLVTAGIILLISDHTLATLILMFNIALLPQACFLDWYYQGKERMANIVIARIIGAIAYVVSVFLLVSQGSNILWVGACVVLGDFAAAVGFLVQYARSQGIPNIRIDISDWKKLLRQSVPMGIGSILGTISVNFPPLAIGYLMTSEDVGIYSAAAKLVFFLLMFDRVIGALLLPASARIFERSPKDFSDRLQTAMKWMLIIAISCSVGGVLIAKNIIVLIYGEQYFASAVILQIGIWYFFFTLLHTVYTTGMIAIGRERLYSNVMAVSTVLYVVTVITGTKLYGVPGAAAAVVVSEAVTLILMHRQFRKFVRIGLPPSFPKILFSACVMGIIVFLLSQQPVLLTIFTGAAIYIGLLLITRAATTAEILALVKQAV